MPRIKGETYLDFSICLKYIDKTNHNSTELNSLVANQADVVNESMRAFRKRLGLFGELPYLVTEGSSVSERLINDFIYFNLIKPSSS